MKEILERIKRKILDYYKDMIDGNKKISCNDFMLFILKCFDEEAKKEPKKCEWFRYDYRTVAPKHHDINNPYWRIPEDMDKLKFCPYCGKEIELMD